MLHFPQSACGLKTAGQLISSLEIQAFLIFRRQLLKCLDQKRGGCYAGKHMTGVGSSSITFKQRIVPACMNSAVAMETAYVRTGVVFPLHHIIQRRKSINIWVTTRQLLAQNPELFPVHVMDFVKEIHVENSDKFTRSSIIQKPYFQS